jgi:hypothetical protein
MLDEVKGYIAFAAFIDLATSALGKRADKGANGAVDEACVAEA